jgi:hypothetical protein
MDHKRIYYTDEQKKVWVEEIRQRPILSFEAHGSVGSTANFSLPLSLRWWWLKGCAEFNEANQIQKADAVVTVSFQRQWRFSSITIRRDQQGNFLPCRSSLR